MRDVYNIGCVKWTLSVCHGYTLPTFTCICRRLRCWTWLVYPGGRCVCVWVEVGLTMLRLSRPHLQAMKTSG